MASQSTLPLSPVAPDATVNVLIGSYLEPEHIEQIRAVDTRLNVIYEPELLPAPRYACDHVGTPRALTPEQEAQRRAHLAQADVLFDFDYVRAKDLPALAPRLRWLQATSAGIGQYVKRMGYAHSMPQTTFTTASGVHAVPLAEFCLLAMLAHFRNLALMQADQRAHRWERFATTDLQGKSVAIVGLGRIGVEVARLCHAFGMRVLATKARPDRAELPPHVDKLYPPAELHALLAEGDVVVLIVPHTPTTERLIDASAFAAMKPGAYLINIARGAVVDEPALVEALRSGKLGGAALDVFATEPLPADSPLWEMETVLISPHSASTSDRENERITALFCDNLRRFLDGRPLRNVLDVERLY